MHATPRRSPYGSGLLLLSCLLLPLPSGGAVAQPPPPDLLEAVGQLEPSDDSGEEREREWLVDEEGKRYYLHAEPKSRPHRRIDEDTVRLSGGLTIRIEKEDEENFYFRVYETVPAPAAEEPEPVTEEPAVSPPQSDRLRFVPRDEGLPASGQWREGFEVVDLDDDGHLDIVHGPPRKSAGTPVVFRGDGEGSWSVWREADFSGQRLDYGDVATADFNRDGRLDVAFAVHLRGVVVMVAGEEEGRFRPWSQGIDYKLPEKAATSDAPPFSSRSLAATDWDGDGWTDLVALGEGPTFGPPSRGGAEVRSVARGIRVYLNRGDGTWTTIYGDGSRAAPFGDALIAADLDGDGREDVVTTSATRGLTSVLFWHDGREPRATPLAGLRPASKVQSLAVGDFDADGRRDLALGYLAREHGDWVSGIDLFLARAERGWEPRVLWRHRGRGSPTAMAAGDLDGDGRTDLAASTEDGEVRVFLGGDEGFTLEASPEIEVPGHRCRGSAIELVDVDGETGDEIVATFGGEPGSETVFVGRSGQARCENGGAVRVWKAVSDSSPSAS